MPFTINEQKQLIKLARDSIAYALEHFKLMDVNLNQYSKNLQRKRASFVTLKIDNHLRGCIGSLEAYQPLVVDVVHNAYTAAFKDPRFPPLNKIEFSTLSIHISILNTPEPIKFISEEHLIGQLRPDIDGLILTEGHHRGTFLPAVWESIPDPATFLQHLKMKAGLPQNYWSDSIRVDRYTVESISS